MKLLFYMNTISHGGAERVITNLATMLSERGYDCTLVTSFRTEWEYKLGPKVKRISIYDKPIGNFIIRNIKLTAALRHIVKEQKTDLLIAFMAQPNYRAAIATIGTKTKTLLSVRNAPDKEHPILIDQCFAKILFRRADAMVFQTEDAQSWFPKSIRDKSRIIFNAVRKEFFETEPSGNRTGIVATGRLSEQKNHALLIKAYAKIADMTDDDLIIYGSGDTSKLYELAKSVGVADRVHLPGQIRDVANTIRSAKLYVMSSDYEGMPNALMEAMAIGLPCISTDCPCGGPRALFSEDMKQYLTPVNDVESLARTMLFLLENDDERERHANNCKTAARQFLPDIVNRQWEEYIREILIDNTTADS